MHFAFAFATAAAALFASTGVTIAPGPSPGTAHEPSEAARAEAPAPPANAGAVSRYDDESPLGYTQGVVVRSVMARTAPGSGGEVTLLVGGTEVVRIAEHGASILVMFPDPKDPSQRAVGWIPAPALQPRPRGPCRGSEVRFRSLMGSFCAAPCRDSISCGGDQTCVPAGLAVEHDGRISDQVMVCIAK